MLENITKGRLNSYEIPEDWPLLSNEEDVFAKSEAFENRESKKDETFFITCNLLMHFYENNLCLIYPTIS